ncbi:mixed lineage kinase domain-like protein [Styela clava]
MVLEIIECVYRVSKKVHQTVEEVKANKQRCKRLSDRVRYLVAPLKELFKDKEREVVYKEALIDLVQTLEEARQFMKTFTRTKTVTKRIQDYCYPSQVKEKFEYLNEKLNDLIPTLTLGLHVEHRRSVRNLFAPGLRGTQDTKDECEDLQEMQQIMKGLGLSALSNIDCADLKQRKRVKKSSLYDIYTAKYRMSTVIVKKLRCTLTPATKDLFINDANKLVHLNSENVVRVFGVSVDPKEDSYLLVMENMELGNLNKILLSKIPIDNDLKVRMAVEASRGLYFIHCSGMLHGNLCSTKFLVNEDFHIKISGFGFSNQVLGENAPGSRKSIFASKKSDKSSAGTYDEKTEIYEFGLVLWQICRRLPKSKYKKNPEPEDLRASESEITDAKTELLAVSSWCCEDDEFARPSMEDILEHLIEYKERVAEYEDGKD